MVEKARRSRVGDEPRADADPSAPDTDREWEVFVRDDGSDPLRHVGSVTAPDVEIAREQSARLFAWYAEDLWLCPADAVDRFSTHDLAAAEDDETEAGADGTEAGADGTEAGADGTDAGTEGTADGTDDAPAVVDEDDVASVHEDDPDLDDEPRVTEL